MKKVNIPEMEHHRLKSHITHKFIDQNVEQRKYINNTQLLMKAAYKKGLTKRGRLEHLKP